VLACALAHAPTAAAIALPGTGGRVDVGGWIDGTLVEDTGNGPYQHPWGRAALEGDADLGRRFTLAFALRGQVGGPYRGASAGLHGWDDAFQNRSPSLDVREAAIAWRLRDADLRAGIQRFAWGKLDGIPPTDVLNPRDYHDPIVEEPEERKLGIPAVSGTYYVPLADGAALSRLEAELVYVPIAVPSRLALEDERWFPSSTAPTNRITRAALARLGVSVGFGVPVDFTTENDAPARTLDAGAVGLRLGGTWRSADWDLYYYAGPETAPDAALRARVVQDRGVIRALSALVQDADAIHMFGADTAFVLGPLAVRAEAAYFLGRPYLRRGADVMAEGVGALGRLTDEELVARIARPGGLRVPFPDLFVDRDAVEWGVGADGVWRGVRPLLQVTQIVLMDAAPRLLIGEPETRLTAQLRKAVFQERVELEWRSVYAIERGGWFALPRVAYLARDDLRLRLGYLMVAGSRHSMIGQFKDNDAVLVDARWSF
jgi:hypothetical protein